MNIENKKCFLDRVPFLSKILSNEIEITIYTERKVHVVIGIKKGLLIIFYAVDLVSVFRYYFFNLNVWVHDQHYWSAVTVNLYGTRSLKFFWLDLWFEPFFRLILFPVSVLVLTFITWILYVFDSYKKVILLVRCKNFCAIVFKNYL